MIRGLVIDSTTGVILRKIVCASEAELDLQAGSGEEARVFSNTDGIYVNDALMKVDVSGGGTDGQIIAIDAGTFEGDLPTGTADQITTPE